MTKKEYIEKAKNAILNRVRFHAPIVYNSSIDKTELFAHGIDLESPIFKFDKKLDKRLLKAFEMAQIEEKFNLLITTSSLGKLSDKSLSKLDNVVLYDPQTGSASFIEMINKLNINYVSNSNYNIIFKDKFFKINNQILNPKFVEYSLKQFFVDDGVGINYSEFVLNGNNFFIKLINKKNIKKTINLELNIPLKKGYYYFKKQNKYILIENLLTKQKMFFNYFCKNAKFSFSNVDGLENSVFCCLNLKLQLSLNAQEERMLFFNFGEGKIDLKIELFEEMKRLSLQKCCEIFNVQVKTKNPKFDLYFNKTLPQKIWINWINGEVDENLESKYLRLKKLFINGNKSFSFVNFKEIGLKEIGLYNGEYYKKILIVLGEEKYLRVGKTFFHNINGISEHSLKSKEPISLCFGNDY